MREKFCTSLRLQASTCIHASHLHVQNVVVILHSFLGFRKICPKHADVTHSVRTGVRGIARAADEESRIDFTVYVFNRLDSLKAREPSFASRCISKPNHIPI